MLRLGSENFFRSSWTHRHLIADRICFDITQRFFDLRQNNWIFRWQILIIKTLYEIILQSKRSIVFSQIKKSLSKIKTDLIHDQVTMRSGWSKKFSYPNSYVWPFLKWCMVQTIMRSIYRQDRHSDFIFIRPQNNSRNECYFIEAALVS